MIDLLPGTAIVLGTMGLCELVRRVTLYRVRPECDHPNLESYGKNSVACTSCDRVWRVDPQKVQEARSAWPQDHPQAPTETRSAS